MKKMNYNKIRFFLCSLIICLAFSVPAWSLTITGNLEVGGIDNLVHYTFLENSSDAGEAAWIEEKLSLSNITITKIEDLSEENSYNNWDQVIDADGPGVWAYDLTKAGIFEPFPDYYLIKTGNVAPSLTLDPPAPDTFLYMNSFVGSQYAVIDLNIITQIIINSSDDIPDNLTIDIFKISHISIDSAPVPEPATMALFGLGLIGIAGIGRKTRKN